MNTLFFNGQSYQIDSITTSFQKKSLLISGKGESLYLNLYLDNISLRNNIIQLSEVYHLNKKQLSYSKIDFTSNCYLIENLSITISEINGNNFHIKGEGKLYEEYDEDPRLDFSFEITSKIEF